MRNSNRLRTLVAVTAILSMGLAAQAVTYKMLLVGDSWAAYAYQSLAFRNAFVAKGFSDWFVLGSTAIGGTTAAQWTAPHMLQSITNELAANPSVKVVHISLGGNDFLGYVNGSRTREELDAFYDAIVANIAVVVEHTLSLHPDIRVGVCSYDYLTRTQSGMSSPAVNAELVLFAQRLRAYADNTERCVYLNNWGLMHHTYGITGVYAPGELPAPGGPPDYLPFAGGDITRPGVQLNDPIHLSSAGYRVLADNCLDQAYWSWLGVNPVGILGIEAVTTPSTAPVLTFRVTFSEPVTGVDLSDFRLDVGGSITDARISGFYGSGAIYGVVVERGFGSGTLTLSLVDDGSIKALLPLASLPGNEYTGATYTIAEDREVPVVAWPAALVLAMAGAAMLRRRRG